MRIWLNKSIEAEFEIHTQNALGNIGYEITHDFGAVVAYVCPHCGVELLGHWKNYGFYKTNCNNEDDKKAIYEYERKCQEYWKTHFSQEVSSIQKLSVCPFCGGELSKDNGYYLEVCGFGESYGLDHDNLANNEASFLFSDSRVATPKFSSHRYLKKQPDEWYQKLFGFMKQVRKETERKSVEKKSQENVLLYDQPVFSSKAIDEIEAIKNTPAKLKEYLQNLIKMEINIYSLSKRLEELYYTQFDAYRKAIFGANLPVYEKKRKIADIEICLKDCIAKIEQYKAGNIGITVPTAPAEPVYKTPNFLNKKKILAENEEIKAQYLLNVKEYESQLHEYEHQKDRMIAEAQNEAENIKVTLEQLKAESQKGKDGSLLVSSASEIKKIIDDEVREAEDFLKKLYECRNGLYAYEIVFGKYRNVVALSTFYEYLMAGRCTALEGADGAYNLYENQIRADMIIGQLSQVIEKLDDIKDSQYMIYSELQTVNRSLDHLNKTMDSALVSIQNMEKDVANISKNTAVIAHNTAVTAHYAKINAELTNALGFMVAFS